jgi:hypothetical protein
MDGNLDGKEMIADLESMKQAGLGNLVFLEVNVGVPPAALFLPSCFPYLNSSFFEATVAAFALR